MSTTPTGLPEPHTDPRARRSAGPAERRLATAAGAYAGTGLLAGLFFRTLTHARDFEGVTTLSLAHTHLLALGMLVMLAVLVLEALYGLSHARVWRWFEPLYHVGMAVTVGAMLVRGTLEVVAEAPTSMAFSGVAGIGHILLTAALGVLFMALLKVTSARTRVA